MPHFTTYTWDFENRLTSVSPPDNGSTSFKYDPFGRRIQKNTHAYVYDGAGILEELNANGVTVSRFVQGAGIDEPLAVQNHAGTFFYNADGLGSITSTTDVTGAIVEQHSYSPFGDGGDATFQPFQFTGRELDADFGLYYYRARYYEPQNGRFLSEDPIRFGGGWNFYVYVGNNPANNIDPTGLQAEAVAYGIVTWWVTHILPNGGFIFYGNWGGPGWTGGQFTPYEDLQPGERNQLKPPINAQDACYKEHDICYSGSRVTNSCTSKDSPSSKQLQAERHQEASCDYQLYVCLSQLPAKDKEWHVKIARPLFSMRELLK